MYDGSVNEGGSWVSMKGSQWGVNKEGSWGHSRMSMKEGPHSRVSMKEGPGITFPFVVSPLAVWLSGCSYPDHTHLQCGFPF